MQESVHDFLKPRVVKVTPVNDLLAKVVRSSRFERGFWPHAGQCAASHLVVFKCQAPRSPKRRSRAFLHEYTSIEGVQEDVVRHPL